MLQLKDFILVIPNLVTIEKASEIIDCANMANNWQMAQISDLSVDEKQRNCQNTILENKNHDEYIYFCSAEAVKKYNEKFGGISISKDVGYLLLKYEQGGFYKQHVDSYKNEVRTLTMSIMLNSDYEGGNWMFFNGEYVLKPEAGSAIIFPSNFMYPHEISPILNGTRYSIVTWFL